MSELRTNRIVPRDGLVSGTNLGGGIIQVRMGVLTGAVEIQGDNAGGYLEISGLNVTITPTRSDSKIMIDAVVNCTANENNYHMGFEIRRGSARLSGFQPTDGGFAVGNRTPSMSSFANNDKAKLVPVPLMGFDAPATTSAVTYKIFGSIESNRYLQVNGSDDSNNAYSVYRAISTIRAWEISG